MRLTPRAATTLLLFAVTLPVEARVQIEHWSTRSGTQAYFVESHALPIVDVSVEFSAGSAYDPADRAGLGRLTLTLMKAGSLRYSEAEIDRRIADAGAELRDNFDVDRAGYALRTLSSETELRAAVDALAEVIQSPRFVSEAFEREKARAIANAAEDETQPDHIAEERLYALMYPSHPYGRTAKPATLSAVTREDVLRHYRAHYGSAGATVTIVGDLTLDAARALAEELTSRLEKGEEGTLPPVVPPRSGETVRVAHSSTQAHVLLGMPALARIDPDYFPILVGNYVLGGGGFVSRLMTEVRSKHGLAYSVYSYIYPSRQEGPFVVGLQTRRDQAGEALKRARDVVAAFVARGPTEAELTAAKESLIGGFPLRIDTNRKLLEQLAVIGFYKLPVDWLEEYPAHLRAVTLEQIRSAFSRRIDPEKLSVVVVGASD